MILVSFNTAKLTVKALDSLFAAKGELNLEVFVVDNASKDNSVAHVKRFYPSITLVENNTNVGFGRANNQVLDLIRGDYLLLLNTDAFVSTDTLGKTIQYMQMNPECGVLGTKLLGRDGELQPSCRYFPTPFNMFSARLGLNRLFPSIKLVDDENWDASISQNCDWVPGCYYLVRKDVINDVGLFDPLYFLYCEEVDHCFAAKKAGWQVTYYADTSVVHIGGESAKSDSIIDQKSRQVNLLRIESELLYFRKNHGILGLLSHVLLTHLADVYDLTKHGVRMQFPLFAATLKNSVLMWQVFFRTKFAKQSTR